MVANFMFHNLLSRLSIFSVFFFFAFLCGLLESIIF